MLLWTCVPSNGQLKWALAWEYASWDMCTQKRTAQMSPSMRICSLGHVYPAKDSSNDSWHENRLLGTCVPSKDSAQMSPSMRIGSLRHAYPARTQLKWAPARAYASWDMRTQQRLSSNKPQHENMLLETCVPSKDAAQMIPSIRICSLRHVYPAKDSAQMILSMRIRSLGHVYPAQDSSNDPQHENMLLETCVPSQD